MIWVALNGFSSMEIKSSRACLLSPMRLIFSLGFVSMDILLFNYKNLLFPNIESKQEEYEKIYDA